MKKFLTLMVISFTIILCSCAKDEYIVGNNINNSVFLNNEVCEDKNYVYVANVETGIKRIDKKDNSITILNNKGSNLNLYNNYLYYQYENTLYRNNTKNINGTPDLLLNNFTNSYLIFNDIIYMDYFYHGIFCMNTDGTNKKMYLELNEDEKYFICGYDNKYTYIIFSSDLKEVKIDEGLILNEYYLSRMSHDKIVEKLFPVYTYYIHMVNDFLLIYDNYSYYTIDGNIVRNKLEINAKKEVLYQKDLLETITLIAIIDQFIYFKNDLNKELIYKFSIKDGSIEEINLFYEDVLFYVDNSKNKLNYIKDNKIFSLEKE